MLSLVGTVSVTISSTKNIVWEKFVQTYKMRLKENYNITGFLTKNSGGLGASRSTGEYNLCLESPHVAVVDEDSLRNFVIGLLNSAFLVWIPENVVSSIQCKDIRFQLTNNSQKYTGVITALESSNIKTWDIGLPRNFTITSGLSPKGKGSRSLVIMQEG